MPTAVEGEVTFANALHAELRSQPGNLFFSPTSIRLALAMTAMGAKGTTAAELDKGLALPADLQRASAGFGAVLASFQEHPRFVVRPDMEEWERAEAASKPATVTVANRLWPQAGRKFEPAFTDALAKRFGAPMEPLDYAAAPEAARKKINAWVAGRTKRMIPELLLPPHVTPDTKLVLTNAIYFKAKWDEPFPQRKTHESEFTTDAEEKVQVAMMARTGPMKYAENELYQAVELPYGDGSLAMTVVLPRAGKSLAEVEREALPAFTGGRVAMERAQVELELPKFKFEARFDLKGALTALGMGSAFQPGEADFSGMDGTRDLSLGAMVHQAVVIVDENGTEAAAATAARMGTMAAPVPQLKSMVADHPFAFFIKDAKTGTLLFVGRLADPSAGK